MSCEEVATRLGVTLDSFRSFYGSRSFPGSIKAGGRVWIAESAVQAELVRRASGGRGIRKAGPAKEEKKSPIVASTDGATAGNAFRLFMQDKPICEVIVELSIPVEIAEHLWTQFAKLSRCILFDSKSVGRLRGILDDWKDGTASGLADAIVRLQQRAARELQVATAPGDQLSNEEAERLRREAESEDLAEAKPKGEKAA